MKYKLDEEDIDEIKSALSARITTLKTMAKGAKKKRERDEWIGRSLKTEKVLIKLDGAAP